MKMHSTGLVHWPCIGGEAHSQTSNGLNLAAGRLVWPATATAAATLEFDALDVAHIALGFNVLCGMEWKVSLALQ